MVLESDLGFDRGTTGEVLTSNGPTMDPSFQPAGGISPSTQMATIFEDFFGNNNVAQLNQQDRGTTVNASSTYVVGHPGISVVQIGAGIVANSLDYNYYGTSVPNTFSPTINGKRFQPSTDGTLIIESLVRYPTLSATALRYGTSVGLFTVAKLSSSTGHLIIKLQDNENSGKFQGISYNGSSTTTVDLGITAAANTWYKLRLEITSTNVDFYINGVLVGNITTNIPAFQLSAGLLYDEISGSGYVSQTNLVEYDYFYMTKTLTTPR